jgi:hypothetical protein
MVSSCGQANTAGFTSFIQSAEKYFLCTKHGSFNPYALPLSEKNRLVKETAELSSKSNDLCFGHE